MPRLPHLKVTEACCSITTITYGRVPLFKDAKNAQILARIIQKQKAKGRFFLLGYVIMPDHLHMILVPQQPNDLSFVMQEIKKESARLINKRRKRKGKVWMDDYYEHTIRGEKELKTKLNYIFDNPVRKGLVERPEDYGFSSVYKGIHADFNENLAGSGTSPPTA